MSRSTSKQPLPPAADVPQDAPPPYEAATANAPVEPVPAYDAARPSSSATTLVAATTKFPPAMNGYFQWAFTRTFHLGPSGSEKLFAAAYRSGVFSGRGGMMIWDGPSEDHAVLATVFKNPAAGAWAPATIRVPARPGSGEAADFSTELGVVSAGGGDRPRVFSVAVGGKETGGEARQESFQWRKSKGEEVKELAKGWGCGWKLVRLSRDAGPAATGEAGGSGAERSAGVTSDGHEIVAVLVFNMKSMTKGLKFSFMGAGLTGAFGERWEIVTLVSALWVWYTCLVE